MSVPDARRLRQEHTRFGYTLVEVLIVMVILSVALGLVAVNFSRDRGALLEEDVRNLALLFQQARDEALIEGRTIVWSANAEGYSLSRRTRAEAPTEFGAGRANEALVSRRWPHEVSIVQLRIAGVPVSPAEPIVFSSSGFNQPYELVLAAGRWRVALAGDFSGRVRVERAREVESAQP